MSGNYVGKIGACFDPDFFQRWKNTLQCAVRMKKYFGSPNPTQLNDHDKYMG
jgi:hypothetical protein